MNAHLALRHPDLLPLLLVALLPLVVHLISKRKAREVRFAAMEFVLRSQRRSARRLQLRQWVLLLARTLGLLAAVGAILGPTWTRDVLPGTTARAPTRHVFALDVTSSMHALVNGQERMRVSVSRAREALRALPPEEPVAAPAEPPRAGGGETGGAAAAAT